jgi:ABC-2 type transport system permease protein
MFFREKQAVFWGFVFPALLLVLFCSVFGGSPERSTALLAGLLCINVMSGSFFGTAVVLVIAREQSILKRYKLAPVALWKVMAGLIISRLFAVTLTSLFLIGLARLIYRTLFPANLGAMALVFVSGAIMFCAISFAIASLTRTSVQANGVAQCLFLPMMFLGGATFPSELMPDWLQKVAAILPSVYFVSGLKSVMVMGGSISDNIPPIAVMGSFSIVAVVLSARFFRWD